MMLAAFDHAARGGERGPHFIFPFLLFLLLGFLIAAVIRRRRGGSHWHTHGAPMQTLQDRFARGEIDRDEFEHRKAVLDGAEVIPPAPVRSAPAAPTPPAANPPADAPAPESSGDAGSDEDADDER